MSTPLITLEEIKAQCKVDLDDDTQDSDLNGYALAACSRVEGHLHRNVYAVREDVADGDADALVLAELRHGGENIKLAIKLLAAHFFKHREATTDLRIEKLPHSVDELLGDHRFLPYGGK